MFPWSFTVPIFHFINIRLSILHISNHCDSCLRIEINYDWGKSQLALTSPHNNNVLGLTLIMKYEENRNEVMKREVYITKLNFTFFSLLLNCGGLSKIPVFG